MVHLSSVPEKPAPKREADSSLASGKAKTQKTTATAVATKAHVELVEYAEEFKASVYGSKYAGEDLPAHEMAEESMPRDAAYRLIKDNLSLDNNPKLNLASFVTTYMEDEAEKLMTECLPKNFIDYEEYPQCADIQNRCVNMIADLFHAPAGSAVGTSSVGSSEAIMLAVLAMKKRWRQRREVEGKPADRPNLVMSAAVQVCWEKAVRYFEVEPRLVYCTPERFVIDPAETVSLCDENTIGICAILGTTYTGEYEDVKGVNDLLVEKDMDVPIHVDAASGGFVAPFVVPDLEWDFRCEKVVSINASGHKYGLVYPGVGWVVWRSPEFLPQELVFNINYLGANQASFTLNFSKSASQVVGQYYQLIRLGRRGYRSIMSNLTRTADFLSGSLAEQGFVIMSKASGEGLPLVAFRFPDGKEKEEQEGKKGKAKAKTKKEKEEEEKGERQYDEFALARSLRSRGWVVPAYTMAPHTGQLKMLRVVVREDFSRSMCDMLIADIKLCCALLEETDRETLQRQESLIRQHALRRNKRRHAQSVYKDEKHSLQGKTGKTHAVC